jgi:hypothetical protein
VGERGVVVQPPQAAGSKGKKVGGTMNISKKKKKISALNKFEILSQIQGGA